MEQTVENKNKSGIKTFFIIILFVVLIDFIIFIINRFNQKFPHITTVATIVLVVLSCSYILIKYFSKYLYIVDKGEIVFYIVIGKRRFQALKVDLQDLIEVKPYKRERKSKTKPDYKFIYDQKADNIYIGRYRNKGKVSSFLFSPNEQVLRKLKRSENNG